MMSPLFQLVFILVVGTFCQIVGWRIKVAVDTFTFDYRNSRWSFLRIAHTRCTSRPDFDAGRRIIRCGDSF